MEKPETARPEGWAMMLKVASTQGDELAHVEGLPVARPHVGGLGVGVPAGRPAVGHDDDEVAACGVVADVVLRVEGRVVLTAAMQQEEHRVAARDVVAVGKQHVDPRQQADRRRGQLVVLHAAVVLVLGHGEGGLRRGRSGDDGAAPYEGSDGETAHALEQDAPVDPAIGLPTGPEVVLHVGLRCLGAERHGMSLGLSTMTGICRRW